MKTYVYWIHNIKQTDPLTEGYIGISVRPFQRFRYHSDKKWSDNYQLTEHITNGAVQTILHECDSREEALELERKYRPTEKIGWNIIAGGIDPPSQTGKVFDKSNYPNHGMRGKKHKPESNVKRSLSMSRIRWWNNGIVQIRSVECPEGYKPGVLFRKKGYKILDTSKMGRKKKIKQDD